MILHLPPVEHPVTPVKVVLLSGLSDPATCALSYIQTQFLASLDVPEAWKVYRNFPYVACTLPRGDPPLWRASLRNLRQFLHAGRPPYRDAARQHWQALAASTDRLVVITLSCGLEIVNHCIEPTAAGPALEILALGPVAWKAPPVSCTLVQGERDYLSKLFFRNCPVTLEGLGHMDYLRHPQVRQLAQALCGSTSNSSAPASTSPRSG